MPVLCSLTTLQVPMNPHCAFIVLFYMFSSAVAMCCPGHQLSCSPPSPPPQPLHGSGGCTFPTPWRTGSAHGERAAGLFPSASAWWYTGHDTRRPPRWRTQPFRPLRLVIGRQVGRPSAEDTAPLNTWASCDGGRSGCTGESEGLFNSSLRPPPHFPKRATNTAAFLLRPRGLTSERSSTPRTTSTRVRLLLTHCKLKSFFWCISQTAAKRLFGARVYLWLVSENNLWLRVTGVRENGANSQRAATTSVQAPGGAVRLAGVSHTLNIFYFIV